MEVKKKIECSIRFTGIYCDETLQYCQFFGPFYNPELSQCILFNASISFVYHNEKVEFERCPDCLKHFGTGENHDT